MGKKFGLTDLIFGYVIGIAIILSIINFNKGNIGMSIGNLCIGLCALCFLIASIKRDKK